MFSKMFKQELKRIFRSGNLYIALSAFLICLSASSAQIWFVYSSSEDVSLLSAMYLCFIPVFFGGTILLVPFCAAISCSQAQADEMTSGNVRFRVLRCGFFRYSAGKMCAGMLAGFVSLGGAFAIHTLIWHLAAGPYDPVNRPDTVLQLVEGTVYQYYLQQPWAYGAYLPAILGFGITGALWAAVSLLCAVLMMDAVLAAVLPVLLYYLWKTNFTAYLFGFSLPDFTGLYNDGVFWPDYWQALIAHFLLLVIVWIAYGIVLKRRIRNA